MNKNFVYSAVVIFAAGMAVLWLWQQPAQRNNAAQGEHGAESAPEVVKGPHRGRLLVDGDFAIELAIFETNVPPEFHVYAYQNGKPLAPGDVQAEVQLTRHDGQVDVHHFTVQNDFLRGDSVVTEPHSFDVRVRASYHGQAHEWRYPNYEGRVQIADAVANESGIKVGRVGPRDIKETIDLTGRVQVDPNRLSQVRARFPGVVKKIQHELGDKVSAGDVLAIIQSNESLQSYEVKAPTSGVIVARDVQVGETTTDETLFTIVDLTTVWVELDVFDRDLAQLRVGQDVSIATLDGESFSGKISWLSPLAAHASQSVQARVVLPNPKNRFRAGQFVRGRVVVGQHPAEIAVRKDAIQSFRDFQVVYARVGDVYEVRMLELGREDSEWVEALGGIKSGTEYVTDNSYLVKADIEKSGASHDH